MRDDRLTQMAIAAHEVKNSLTVLKAIATYTLAYGPLDPADREPMTRINTAADQVLAVVQRLMTEASVADRSVASRQENDTPQ